MKKKSILAIAVLLVLLLTALLAACNGTKGNTPPVYIMSPLPQVADSP